MANRGRHRKKITPEKAFNLASFSSLIIIKFNIKELITFQKHNFTDYHDLKRWFNHACIIYANVGTPITQIVIYNNTFNPSEII